MTAGREPQTGPVPSPDDLRRRLYRAGATSEDVQRYLAERLAERPQEDTQHLEPEARRPVRRHRRAGVALGLLAVAAALVLVRPERGADPSAPAATPEPALLQAIGEGRVLAVQQGSVSNPTPVAVEVRGTTVVGERFRGRGNAVVAMHPPDGSRRGGHASIDLTSSGRTAVDWRALFTETRNETTTYPVVVARGTTSADTAPTVFEYPRLPPTRIAIAAAQDVGWTLVVAVTGGGEPRLR